MESVLTSSMLSLTEHRCSGLVLHFTAQEGKEKVIQKTCHEE